MKVEWSIASVTVTWNPGKAVEGHIQALLRQTRPLDEIVVVDNASTDGTGELLKREFPEVRLLAEGRNTGMARGLCAGLEYSCAKRHDWI